MPEKDTTETRRSLDTELGESVLLVMFLILITSYGLAMLAIS